MPKNDFSATQVARIAGINYQTLDRWLTDGVIVCDVPAEGTGSRRRFTRRDVVFVFLARALKDAGLHMSAIGSYLRMLHQAWTEGDPDHAGFIMLRRWGDQYGGLWLPDPARALEFLPSVQSISIEPGNSSGIVILVDLADLAKQAEQAIAAAA